MGDLSMLMLVSVGLMQQQLKLRVGGAAGRLLAAGVAEAELDIVFLL